MTDPIDVALCFDDHLALPGAVTILSLLATRREEVRLHILTDPAPKAAPLLRAIAARHGASLRIVDTAAEARHAPDLSSPYGIPSTATYRRLFLAELLPDLGRILYLDADILVRHCLGPLWRTDLGDAILGAAPDPWMASLDSTAANFPGGYFNAGVLLVELEHWRADGLGARCLEEIARYKAAAAAAGVDAVAYAQDQTPLNAASRGLWKPVSPRWNFTTFHTPRLAAALGMSPPALSEIAEDPAIVHFLGAYKPWLPSFGSLTAWHRGFRAFAATLEEEYDLDGLSWPRAFSHGREAAGARRLMALRLVHRARTMALVQPTVVLSGLLAGEVAIVAREQRLPLAGFASENPRLSGGTLHGLDIITIADAIDRGRRDFIVADYRRLPWICAAVEEQGARQGAALRLVTLTDC